MNYQYKSKIRIIKKIKYIFSIGKKNKFWLYHSHKKNSLLFTFINFEMIFVVFVKICEI